MKTGMEYWDMDRPEPKQGEVVCDYCWRVDRLTGGWMYFNFKYLKPVWLCPDCTPKESEKLTHLQRYGL